MRGKKVGWKRRQTVLKYHQMGMSMSSIAVKMKLGVSTIQNICSSEPKRLTSKEKCHHLLVNENKSVGETATICDISPSTVLGHISDLSECLFVNTKKIPPQQIPQYRSLAAQVERIIQNSDGKIRKAVALHIVAKEHADTSAIGKHDVGEVARRIEKHMLACYRDEEVC